MVEMDIQQEHSMKNIIDHPYAPFVFVTICLLVLYFGQLFIDYRQQDQEISLRQYYSLESTAKMSCGGMNYLKKLTSSGPILKKDLSKIDDYLEDQARMSERANLADNGGSC